MRAKMKYGDLARQAGLKTRQAMELPAKKLDLIWLQFSAHHLFQHKSR